MGWDICVVARDPWKSCLKSVSPLLSVSAGPAYSSWTAGTAKRACRVALIKQLFPTFSNRLVHMCLCWVSWVGTTTDRLEQKKAESERPQAWTKYNDASKTIKRSPLVILVHLFFGKLPSFLFLTINDDSINTSINHAGLYSIMLFTVHKENDTLYIETGFFPPLYKQYAHALPTACHSVYVRFSSTRLSSLWIDALLWVGSTTDLRSRKKMNHEHFWSVACIHEMSYFVLLDTQIYMYIYI